jgi:ElaB/YqjD/DUF883 family membrane-anchored ribosome-binding protein
MSAMKEKPAAFDKAKAQTKRQIESPTLNTILVAASVGILIGLLLRR